MLHSTISTLCLIISLTTKHHYYFHFTNKSRKLRETFIVQMVKETRKWESCKEPRRLWLRSLRAALSL